MKVVHASGSIAVDINMLEPTYHLAFPWAHRDCHGRLGKQLSGYEGRRLRKADGVENCYVTTDIVVKR